MERSLDALTYYLPAERDSAENVQYLREQLVRWAPLKQAMDECPEALVVLNEARQILYANPAFVQFADVPEGQPVEGARLGEVMSCIQVGVTPGGCGTGYGCRNCMVAGGILSAQRWTGAQFHELVHVTQEGPQEVPVRTRVETVIVSGHRLLFCRISTHAGRALEPGRLAGVPADLQDLAALMSSGGPFCPY